MIAQITYTEKIESLQEVADADGLDDESSDEEGASEPTGSAQDAGKGGAGADQEPVLWDMIRPFEGSCKLEFLDFDSPMGKNAHWHSSAHILGQALEKKFGGYLTIGPPLENGFYYDMFIGNRKIAPDTDMPVLEKEIEQIVKADQVFTRCVLSKEDALELFQDNPFKVQLITDKIPDGGMTSCYKNGPLIDLCRGPHVPSTSKAGAFWLNKNSSCYWFEYTRVNIRFYF